MSVADAFQWVDKLGSVDLVVLVFSEGDERE